MMASCAELTCQRTAHTASGHLDDSPKQRSRQLTQLGPGHQGSQLRRQPVAMLQQWQPSGGVGWL